VLQLALAILTDKRGWQKAVDNYRALAAYIQDELGDQDEWSLDSSSLVSNIMDKEPSGRFGDHLPNPQEIEIDDVELDDLTRAEENALCEKYDISRYKREETRRKKLQQVKQHGPGVLESDQEEDSARPDSETEVTTFDRESEAEEAEAEDKSDRNGTTPPEASPEANPESQDDATSEPSEPGDEPASQPETSQQGNQTEEDSRSDDTPEESPATAERLQTLFQELNAEMADLLADRFETLGEILSSDPQELLEHEEIDRTIVTRLAETISWSSTIPIRDQSPVDLSDVSQGEQAESDAEPQSSSTSGDETGDTESSEPTEEQGAEDPSTAMADGSGVVDERTGADTEEPETASPDADGESKDLENSANPWAPTSDGYRVRGANSARLYRKENSSGDWDVFAESDSGTTYKLHEGLGSLNAGELLTRLSKLVSPVTIERGGEDLQAVIADIDAAELVERVDEQESEDESEPDTGSEEDSSEESENSESLDPETIKDEFDVHGPPAYAVASAFDTRQALVDAVQGDNDLAAVDGVGETTAQALRDKLLEADSDGDSASSGTSKPQQPGAEFEWVGDGKALRSA